MQKRTLIRVKPSGQNHPYITNFPPLLSISITPFAYLRSRRQYLLLKDDRLDIVDLYSPTVLYMHSGIYDRMVVWSRLGVLGVYELFEQKLLPPLRFVRTPRSFRPDRLHKFHY